MDVSEPVRVWVAEALSGTIVGEVTLSGSSTWGSRFGGGTFKASISTGHLRSRTGGTLDWAAIGQVVEWTTGGKYTLVLTLGTVCLGEWLIMERTEGTTEDGVVPVAGVEWDGYPAFRYLERDLRYTSAPRMQLASILLTEVFTQGQSGMQITVPGQSGLGSRVAMDHRRASAYYSDVLEEIADVDDGFDWRIVPTVSWSGGAPTRVVRTVQFGAPVLARNSGLVIDYDGPGFRSGNCIDYRRGFDYSRSAAKVWGAGAGQGDDQVTWEATWPELTSQGFVLTSSIVSRPSIKDSDALGYVVRGERDAAKNVHDPARATVLLAKIPSFPRVGDAVTVDIEPTYSLPNGREGSMVLGETSLTLDGHFAHTVNIDGI